MGYGAGKETAEGFKGFYWGEAPYRKRKVLSTRIAGSMHAVAYFRDDESYERFTQMMIELLGLEAP